MMRFAPLAVIALLFSFSCKKESHTTYYSNGPVDSLKINQISILASHNSYHLKPDSAIYAMLLHVDSLGLSLGYNPIELDYGHLPLTEQLTTYHLRGLELDVWNDPEGGHYYNRAGLGIIGKPTASGIPALLKPGFKIMHIPDIDFNPTNYTFVDALQEIKRWSDANPNHLPVFINVETEVQAPGDIGNVNFIENLVKAIPFDASAADNLDLEVKSVFGTDLKGVITPDDVRGNYATLGQAALAQNWPKLGQARGKVLFIIDPDGNSGQVYMAGHPSLKGRAMFVYTNPGTPESAFVKLNDARSSVKQIQQNVALGYIVRTMSDDATLEARAGDYTGMYAAFGSWAQIVSTDYYRPDSRAGTPGWSDYHVALPGGGAGRVDSVCAIHQTGLGPITE
jgi:Phosphoinositide phospholipase C, Ca2+-dependent